MRSPGAGHNIEAAGKTWAGYMEGGGGYPSDFPHSPTVTDSLNP